MSDKDDDVTRVAVAVGRPEVRAGLAPELIRYEGINVVDAVCSIDALIELLKLGPVDVAIFDVDTTSPRDPGSVCADARQFDTQVIAVADRISDAQLLDLFRHGAGGVVLLGQELWVLAFAVRIVSNGGAFVDPEMVRRLVTMGSKGRPGSQGPLDLTVQQQRVIGLLPEGLTNREIGEELGISVHTVKSHLHAAMAKLEVSDRREVAAIVEQEGLGHRRA